jgi:large subunit ribosomal protein L15
MELHNLQPAQGGSTKNKKRIARGQGSGRGGTSTKGHKGDKSRAGHKLKRNFEGGQMPLQMRLPKVGFKSPNRVEYVGINLERLQEVFAKAGVSEITVQTLIDHGVVRKTDRVKILGRGELEQALTVSAHAFSETAKQGIEAKGGSVNLV